jgi:hypothetical protein
MMGLIPSLEEALTHPRRLIDLHLHTKVSDGTVTVTETLELAAGYGLEVISMTDHDSLDGYREVANLPAGTHVRVLSGVEIDTQGPGFDPEILGYGVDFENGELAEELGRIQAARRRRAEQLIEGVNEKLGRKVLDRDDVFEPGRVAILKPHITRPLVSKGVFSSTEEARRFLAAEVSSPKLEKMSPKRAIELVHHAGGKAVLAHPGYYVKNTDLDQLVESLAKAGLDGLEGEYPYRFSPAEFPSIEAEREMCDRIRALAGRHSLLLTTGSDCHTSTDWTDREEWRESR